MAAMVAAAAMADEPAVDLSIAEFKGDAKVTWGVDLDADAAGGGRTGFKNETSAELKVNIVKGGDKSTEGEGVWGEIKVKADGDFVAKSTGDVPAFEGGKATVDTAKLHIGDLYVGIKSGDTQVGGLNLSNAIKSDKFGVDKKGYDAANGLVVGYGNDLFGVDVDFRSKNTGDDYYTDDYALAAEAELKDLSGFGAKAGVSFALKDHGTGQVKLGLFGSASYKMALGDNTLKASVGYGAEKREGLDDLYGEVAGSVLYSWGDEADSAVGGYYLGDETKKRTPGVGVAVYVPLYKHTTIDIIPSFYSGEIIENLSAGLIGEFLIPVDMGDNAKVGMAVAGNVSYKLAVGDAITVTPKAGFRFFDKNYGAGGKVADIFTKANTDNSGLTDTAADPDGLVNVSAGVEVGGIIPNVTFEACYQSRNLVADAAKAGTFNISAKIAF